MSSYFELDERYGRLRWGPTRSKKKRKAAAGGSAAGPSVAASRSVSRRARAFSGSISYRVSGQVPPLRQPTGMTCWATVTTMMMEWRENASMSIETALGRIGATYVAKFRANQGLLGNEKAAFLAAAGLVAEPPMSYTIEGWLQMLRTYGPLWVTTDEDPSADFAIHARILVAIEGDGTTGGTTLRIVDPATATEYSESYASFLRKYEEEAASGAPLRIQVVHWPANAQSTGQSLGGTARSFATNSRSWRPRSAALSGTLAWGARVSPEFRDRVRAIASTLGCDPNHLMAAMAFETGQTFDPAVRNRVSGATGLIQFMPSTARSLGTTTDDLAAMTAVQQLDYVERYFAPYRGRLHTIEDTYMAILWPRAVGQSASAVLFARPTRAYEQNRGLDANGDGQVTKQEAAAPVRRALSRGEQSGNAG